MAARATGSGTISFGLVSIPVKVYSTVDTTRTIRFNYLAKDGARLKQQYIKSTDGSVVPREERVQGYEFSKGQYVIFSDEEMKALYIDATGAIEITEFVPLDQVERLYIEKVNYLGPDKGAARSYHLLRAAMAKTGRAAIAKYAARGRSYLVLLRPMGEGIVMEQLKHQDELRPFEEVPLDTCEINEAELDLAIQIVEQIASDEFVPEKYTDEIRERMLEMIERKVEGQDVTVAPEEEPEAKIVDLMEALKASVAGRAAKGAAGAKGAGAKKPARRSGRKAEPASAKKRARG